MKTARIVFMVLGIALLMFVIAPVASAQNTPGFGVWNGTLLQLKTTTKGYYYSPTTLNNLNAYDKKISEGETQWGVVTGDITGTFEIDVYSKGSNNECVYQITLPLTYVAGSQVDFVANLLIDEIDTYVSGLVYVKAKLDNTGNAIKQGGNISTVAAHSIERGFDEPLDLAANGLTIKGKVVGKLGCTLAP
jgi:hypothetical protein